MLRLLNRHSKRIDAFRFDSVRNQPSNSTFTVYITDQIWRKHQINLISLHLHHSVIKVVIRGQINFIILSNVNFEPPERSFWLECVDVDTREGILKWMSIYLGVHGHFASVSFGNILYKAFDAIYVFVQLSRLDVVLLFLLEFEFSLGAQAVGVDVVLVWRWLKRELRANLLNGGFDLFMGVLLSLDGFQMQIVQFLREYCRLLWFFTLSCFGRSSTLLNELLDEISEFRVV